ncbi:MAG: hemolysin III family protein [Syntrophomonadaceae bacterium]|nr:hemolysin III family protein [Syntrophomonadaceae bacterium]
MSLRLRDPVSGLTHMAGIPLSILGTVLLIYYAAVGATTWHVVAFSIYGASLFLLYTSSSLYHSLPVSDRGVQILRRIDHSMIYVLIAGTYTPICLVPLRGAWGWSLFGSIWGLAVAGIIMTILWFEAPRWLTTLIYVLMGWLVVIAFVPLIHSVPLGGVIWLVVGGVLYSVGAIIYATKWPRLKVSDFFGFHELFHLFVLAGSFCHYWVMWGYILHL